MAEFDNYIQSTIDASVIEGVLQRSYSYYRNLQMEFQPRFVERLSYFISQKKFVGRKDLRITDEIRIIVSACAVQVTFGLDSFTLDNFEYVVIYPDVYESPITHKWHKGETNLNGFICLSWKHILEGIENQDDNYNLGVHEWTHALRFNSIKFDETDYFFDAYINKWVSVAMHEYAQLKAGKPSIFRRYGATNIHEFLSVSIEHFFESPVEFKEKAPELFKQTCILLNQVPAKDKTGRVGVRTELLKVNSTFDDNQTPQFCLEASFFRTLMNFGFNLIYFGILLFVLLVQNYTIPTVMAGIQLFLGIVIMNNKYFTIKFYENDMYLQSGFVKGLAQTFTINYASLMKIEIHEDNFESSFGTVFELTYYNGSRFAKKTAYCSAIDVPEIKIKDFLQSKNVAALIV